jgi:hypothetical protein
MARQRQAPRTKRRKRLAGDTCDGVERMPQLPGEGVNGGGGEGANRDIEVNHRLELGDGLGVAREASHSGRLGDEVDGRPVKRSAASHIAA